MSLSSVLSDFFVSNAFAQGVSPAAPSQSGFMNFVPLILIFIIFYFLLIRPQQKKTKKHQQMVSDLKIGNRVCTNSGIFGVIREIDKDNNSIDLEVAKGVVIKVLKFSVSEVSGKVIEKDKKNKVAPKKSRAKPKK